MAGMTLTVNGARHEVDVASDTPLLYVLRNDLGLNGPQFGCGLSQCGSCSVLVDGTEERSCVMSVSRVVGKEVTTLEGLADKWAKEQRLSAADAENTLHPVQQAWIDGIGFVSGVGAMVLLVLYLRIKLLGTPVG